MTGTQGVNTILHPVTDLEKAKPVYAALLGVEPMADSPYDPDGNVLGILQDPS